MSYGLRFYTISQSLGTSHDYFVQNGDMPETDSARGYERFSDFHTTPTGNTFIYDKARIKDWNINFVEVTTEAKDSMQHICDGWMGLKQITAVYFGTLVTSGASLSTLASGGQCYGTCFLEMVGKPREVALDLWNFEVHIREFGPDQSFT